MLRYVLVSIGSRLLFGILDGLINANPVAEKLYQVYKPIARTSVNALAGIAIDLAYGFIMAGIFLLLYQSLPGGSGIVKGLSFGLIAWFFRIHTDNKGRRHPRKCEFLHRFVSSLQS